MNAAQPRPTWAISERERPPQTLAAMIEHARRENAIVGKTKSQSEQEKHRAPSETAKLIADFVRGNFEYEVAR